MSSSGSGEHREKRAAPAEQHLGDRLAAFVDGELTDDSRDRVQAHLVTCPQCKAAATEQRRLKSVVAASELPAISAGLMARLQGLAACGGEDDGMGSGSGPWSRSDADDDGPAAPSSSPPSSLSRFGAGIGSAFGSRSGSSRARDEARRSPFDGGLLGSGVFAPDRREEFSFLGPARDLVDAGDSSRGFRVHDLTRAASAAERQEQQQEARRERDEARARADERAAAAVAAASGAAAASRSRRFAFAAAGAFSMAAIAIGGALPMEAAVDSGARPDDGPAVSPFSANSVADTRGATPRDLLDVGVAGEERRARVTPGAVPSVSARTVTVAAASAAASSSAAASLVIPAAAPGQTSMKPFSTFARPSDDLVPHR